MKKITIPEQIKAIRANLGLTQKALADKVPPLNRQNIADYETGRGRISAENMDKIRSLVLPVQRVKSKGQGETAAVSK
jgi:transcriptional regulator with XRE-family HTH domain